MDDVDYSQDVDFDVPLPDLPEPLSPLPASSLLVTSPVASLATSSPTKSARANTLHSIMQSIQVTPVFEETSVVQPQVEMTHNESEPLVQEAANPPMAPQSTPMARLPSARVAKQVAKKRVQAADPPLMRSASPDLDNSYEIQLITGGSSLDGLTYRVLWKGWDTLLDWWEALDAAGSFDDGEYHGRLVQVLPQGVAPEVSSGKAPPKKKCLVLVLGIHLINGQLEAFEADGTPHKMDLAGCFLDAEPPCDWLLKLEDERSYMTDALLGEAWTSDSALIKTRSTWDGSQYPSIDDAMAVLRVAAVPIQDNASQTVASAMIEVNLFLITPKQELRENTKTHAATVRSAFLYGGLLHDSLSVILNIEESCVNQMAFFSRQHARLYPGEAAWDAAVATGTI